MLKLIIEDDEGRKTVVPFVRDEITIGRQEGNTIRLTERNVSRRHARLVRLNGHVVVEDLGSYNGTRLNGERIAGQSPLKEGDLIQIGDYDLALQSEGAVNAGGPITTKVPSTYTPPGATPTSLRKTEPAMEAMAPEPEQEEDVHVRATAEMPAEDEEEGDGDGDEHTPPSAAQRRHSTSIIRLDQVEADRPRQVEDVSAEDAPRLLVLAPDEFKGQEFACIRTELRIGRTDDNDIALDHRSLSRTHVKLVREESGEWRVIDMQSANGLTVNGESYAQATLNSGDIIELGHVKLRFLNAGDAADDLPASEGGGRSKLPLVAGLVALLLGAGAAAFFALRAPTAPEPVQVVEPTPPEAVSPPSGNTPPPVEARPPGNTPQAPAGPSPEQVLADAERAVRSNDFETAQRVLSSAVGADGRLPASIEQRLGEVTAELNAKQQLAVAREALATGELDAAANALEASKGTQAFKSDHDTLSAQLTALSSQQAPSAPVATPTAGTAAPTEEGDEIKDLVARCRVLLKKKEGGEGAETTENRKNYLEALQLAKQCARLAPSNPDCQLMLGATEARLGNIDRGAEHYRKFLQLAPETHKSREGVQKLLNDYDKIKKPKQGG